MNEWGTTNPVVAGDIAGFYSVEFIAKDTSHEFKFANSDWTVEFCQAKENSTLTTALAGVKFSSVGNDKVEGLTKGKAYKFEIIAGPTTIEATLVEGSMEGITPPAAEEEDEEADEEEVVEEKPVLVSVPVDHFAVKFTGLELEDGAHDWNSNISWGGAKGTWAGSDYVKGTGAITVNVVDGVGVMYISNDYAADGWAVGEAKPDTNFKLKIAEGKERWFKIEVPSNGYCVINWADGVQ